MSKKYIKSKLETKLYNLYNGVQPIQWNGTALDTSIINLYIRPEIDIIRTHRHTIGGLTGLREVFVFRVEVLSRNGSGTGNMDTLIEDLQTNFKEQIVSSVILKVPTTIPQTIEGEFLVSGITVTGEYLSNL